MPKVRLRESIAQLPSYVPGARPDGTLTEKLSSNENPFPPLPSVVAAVADAAADLNRYPDLTASRLVHDIAAHVGVEPGDVVVGNGSVALLETLLTALLEPGDEVVYPWRSFEAYPIAIAIAGGEGVAVPLTADSRHDLPAMAAAVTDRTKAVILCSPNNPTGAALREAEVRDLLAALPEHVLVLLDEAYHEFIRLPDGDAPAVDGLGLLRDDPRVVLLRTFSKAYGLAGLRVGYAIARPRIAKALRSTSTPFGVNALAQVAAVESLRQERELLARVEELISERERLVAALRDAGWDIPEAQGNFVWFPVGERAGLLARVFERAGILVRPFAGGGVRVTVGDREANDAVIAVAAGARVTMEA